MNILQFKERLRIALIDWIEKSSPDLWVTITFAKEATNYDLTLKRLKQFLSRLNTARFEFYPKYIWLWAIFEKTVNGYHIHALIKGIDPSSADRLQKRCNNTFGKSEVKPFDYSKKHYSAIDYIVNKYVYRGCDNLEPYKVNSRYRRKKDKELGLAPKLSD